MLRHLYIKNFALIDELDIDFHEGFSVITGETGAGKSIILGAIALLLGQRADQKSIKSGAERCIIEALFDLSSYDMKSFFDENDIDYDGGDCIIRRELTSASKSRSFVNDTPTPLSVLKELGEQLVDVHSQHQNLLLQKQDFQLSLVDVIANSQSLLQEYGRSYNALLAARKSLDALRAEIETDRRNADFLQFQYDELSSASLTDGEQEELEQKSMILTHAEDIKSALYDADTSLSDEENGVVKSLRTAISALSSVEKVLPEAVELISRLDSAYIDLKDVAMEVSNSMESVEFDPAELDNINARLDRIYSLEKKYHLDSIASLIALRDELSVKIRAIVNSDDAVDEQERLCLQLEAECQRQADALTKLRQGAAQTIEKEVIRRLAPLAMPNVRFTVTIAQTALGSSGQDKVAYLFSANTSTPLRPVAQVASGGEIARVMLALKAIISGAVKLPTIIFDEIDTGVSGKTAEKMAEIMHEMGQEGRQVISITHLPQIAALGTSHYRVEKRETASGTVSSMTELTAGERVVEIAQMLSGSDVTDAAIENARELLRKRPE